MSNQVIDRRMHLGNEHFGIQAHTEHGNCKYGQQSEFTCIEILQFGNVIIVCEKDKEDQFRKFVNDLKAMQGGGEFL